MKILFTTSKVKGASTVMYAGLLRHLSSLPGVAIDMFNSSYADYDVILFMGYDPDVGEARAANPRAKIGVIDVRPASAPNVADADFLVANGIEMKDWYSRVTPNIYLYPPYPIASAPMMKEHVQSRKIIVGYHGNLVHLQEMNPRITSALEGLASDYQVEFWAMYNMEQLGRWTVGLPDPAKVAVRHIQWSEDGYDQYMSQVDIGLVPNLMPLRDAELLKRKLGVSKRLFLEDHTDYLMRYKASSNGGRVLVFAQYGIPIVADMFPSALQYISDGYDGFIAYASAAWYRALKALADSSSLRQAMAQRMHSRFMSTMSADVLNKGLIAFIEALDGAAREIPREVGNTSKESLGWRYRWSNNAGDFLGVARRVRRLLHT